MDTVLWTMYRGRCNLNSFIYILIFKKFKTELRKTDEEGRCAGKKKEEENVGYSLSDDASCGWKLVDGKFVNLFGWFRCREKPRDQQ